MKSQGELEAAICGAVSRFQQEYLGHGPRTVRAHLVDNRLFVHMDGVLTAAEQRLLDSRGAGDQRGADLFKMYRSHLVVAGRSILDALVHEAAGTPAINLHHDISPVTGEEVIVITLAATPACRDRKRR